MRSGVHSRAACAVAALTATTACGESVRHVSGPTPIAPVELAGAAAKSGERLRAISWLSEDGLSVPTGRFFDTERNEECSFQPANASEQHCLPDAAGPNLGFDIVDADCRTPVFSACYDYARLDLGTACSSAPALYELGDVIQGDPKIKPDCSFSLKTEAGGGYRRIGARIPNEAFVRASASSSTPAGARLGVQQLSGEDGSALLLGFYDAEEDEPCAPFHLPDDGTRRCVPSSIAYAATYFDEETCSGTGRRYAEGACRRRVAYSLEEQALYRLGKAVARVPDYYFDGARCWESGGGPGFEVADAVPLSAFEELVTTERGEGRVRMGTTETADGLSVVPDPLRSYFQLRDQELERDCMIAVASDGAHRCVPLLYGTYQPNLFADDRCETPLAALTGGKRDESEPAWLVWTPTVRQIGCPNPASTRVFELASEPFTGTFYIPSSDADGNPLCVEYTGTRDDPLFEPAREVDPARFVRVERVAE
ncbi:MAG TPA: hypothetical protein VNN72_18555 [Polyangiaceae bacterium]|nr:hypothetical protein [Polyangiaceae bacterium]